MIPGLQGDIGGSPAGQGSGTTVDVGAFGKPKLECSAYARNYSYDSHESKSALQSFLDMFGMGNNTLPRAPPRYVPITMHLLPFHPLVLFRVAILFQTLSRVSWNEVPGILVRVFILRTP